MVSDVALDCHMDTAPRWEIWPVLYARVPWARVQFSLWPESSTGRIIFDADAAEHAFDAERKVNRRAAHGRHKGAEP